MEKSTPFRNTISNDDTAQLPAAQFPGEIVVVDQENQIEAACEELARETVIGFDTETRPSFKAGIHYRVSLLQLSTPKRCFLFRLCRIPLDKPILRLLENPNVRKIGAAVSGDLNGLKELRHFREAGFVDLQQIVNQWGIDEKSIRKMSAIVLGERVSKAQRLSNWEAASLTPQQQMYAATDAWICGRIYEQLSRTPKPHKKAKRA